MFEIQITDEWFTTWGVVIDDTTEYDCPEFDITEYNDETIYLEATVGEERF